MGWTAHVGSTCSSIAQAATSLLPESLIYCVRSLFGDNIRVFVSQLAMSGGTVLALMGKESWMGKHGSLGPVDPPVW